MLVTMAVQDMCQVSFEFGNQRLKCLRIDLMLPHIELLFVPDEAKSRHNIGTANVNISARHPCFRNSSKPIRSSLFLDSHKWNKLKRNSESERPGVMALKNRAAGDLARSFAD
ncbi:hypothetical protein DY000_02034200 [Brassica cretica]|uniref:Uncharacterized protein n=1 Tax=Brassica cretica TaxID=69181 RepID=A0ABQ7DPG9_BRACR|nr:hypothetical protein DY000_02034200 [Brassica cretica]